MAFEKDRGTICGPRNRGGQAVKSPRTGNTQILFTQETRPAGENSPWLVWFWTCVVYNLGSVAVAVRALGSSGMPIGTHGDGVSLECSLRRLRCRSFWRRLRSLSGDRGRSRRTDRGNTHGNLLVLPLSAAQAETSQSTKEFLRIICAGNRLKLSAPVWVLFGQTHPPRSIRSNSDASLHLL